MNPQDAPNLHGLYDSATKYANVFSIWQPMIARGCYRLFWTLFIRNFYRKFIYPENVTGMTVLESDVAEEEFYGEIVAVYEEATAAGVDLTSAGSNLMLKLSQLVKEDQVMFSETMQNCLILIQSLFFSPNDNPFELKLSPD